MSDGAGPLLENAWQAFRNALRRSRAERRQHPIWGWDAQIDLDKATWMWPGR